MRGSVYDCLICIVGRSLISYNFKVEWFLPKKKKKKKKKPSFELENGNQNKPKRASCNFPLKLHCQLLPLFMF